MSAEIVGLSCDIATALDMLQVYGANDETCRRWQELSHRVQVFAEKRDLTLTEALSAIQHEAAMVLGLEGDPLPARPRRRRGRRRRKRAEGGAEMDRLKLDPQDVFLLCRYGHLSFQAYGPGVSHDQQQAALREMEEVEAHLVARYGITADQVPEWAKDICDADLYLRLTAQIAELKQAGGSAAEVDALTQELRVIEARLIERGGFGSAEELAAAAAEQYRRWCAPIATQ